MKPTPSKLVLLMSAAGLGLSWSGVALAASDSHAPVNVALTFGVAPRSEQACDTQSADAWALCPASHGELVSTIVAKTAALPLPLVMAGHEWNTGASFRSFDVDAAEAVQRADAPRTASDPPAPDDHAPPPNVPITARGAEDSSHERETNALAMVLLDDLQDIAVATASDTAALVYVHTSVAAAAAASGLDADQRVGQRERDAQAVAAADAVADDSTSIDRVFASLAEVLGAQLDTPSSGIEAKPDQSAATGQRVVLSEAPLPASVAPVVVEQPTQSLVLASPATATLEENATLQQPSQALVIVLAPSHTDQMAPVAVEQPAQRVVEASPVVAAVLDEGAALHRSSEAEEIVVASSHSDKILMSLEALRSGERVEQGRLGAQTKKTVVVSHADKVLETLALFQAKKPKRAAWACTGVSDEEVRVDRRSAPHADWDVGESPAESALAGIGLELDILLDLELPVAARLEQPALLVAPTHANAVPSVAAPQERSAIGGDLVALNADQLDEIRGGFVTEGGLKISFGIERAVYLNGTLVTTTSLNIADLSKISGGQAQITGNGTAGSLAVLQSGAGNVFAPGTISSTTAGTVIQNTLDNQKINTITRIDAVVNSVGIMRSMNLQSSMQSAIVNSLRR